jgi:hypothetical protein
MGETGIADLDDLQRVALESLFGESRLNIVGMQYPELMFRDDPLKCRDNIGKLLIGVSRIGETVSHVNTPALIQTFCSLNSIRSKKDSAY